MTKLGSVVRLLQREHDHLTKQIRGVAAALEAFGAAYGKQNGNRKISVGRTGSDRGCSEGTMGKG